MKRFLKRIPIWLLILGIVGYGVWQGLKEMELRLPEVPVLQDQGKEQRPAYQPENVFALGTSFDILNENEYEGTLRCKVTGAQVVSGAEDCPAKELFTEHAIMGASGDGEEKIFEYEEWFTEGGAYDHGCMIVLVDLELTNVDAKGHFYDGGTTATSGHFKDPYVFGVQNLIFLADLSRPGAGDYAFYKYWFDHSSIYGSYGTDDPETMGAEDIAVRLEPGQTASFTMGFLTFGGDMAAEPEDLMAVQGANSHYKMGKFIDLGLGKKEGEDAA